MSVSFDADMWLEIRTKLCAFYKENSLPAYLKDRQVKQY